MRIIEAARLILNAKHKLEEDDGIQALREAVEAHDIKIAANQVRKDAAKAQQNASGDE